MAVHRPHPITGPWPWVAISTDARPLDPTKLAPLVAREPTDEALIYCDPDDATLFDACERCAQHAEHPFRSLDDDHLGPLVKAALLDGGMAYDPPDQPTDTQQRAVGVIRREWEAANGVLRRVYDMTGDVPIWVRGAVALEGWRRQV